MKHASALQAILASDPAMFDLVLRPTPRFAGEKRAVYLDRVQSKGWLAIWPRLRVAP